MGEDLGRRGRLWEEEKTLEGGGLLSEKKSSPSQTHLLSRNFPKLPCRNGRKLGEILFMGGFDEIAMYMTFSLAQTKEGML